jgi:hypothetical protein
MDEKTKTLLEAAYIAGELQGRENANKEYWCKDVPLVGVSFDQWLKKIQN